MTGCTRALLDALGGLSEAIVENREWRYMLEEETRHSLSIEGYFATEQELKAVLGGRKRKPEILNYYRTAQMLYELALQDYRGGTFRLDLSLIRHIHSELFRELVSARQRGRLRQGELTITGASVRPPAFDLDRYLQAFCLYVTDCLERFNLLSALARTHALFESIHPFDDGNGRVGRILQNYIAISSGYPPLVIKGETEAQRQRYYSALEQADRGFHNGFPAPEVPSLEAHLEQGNFEPLEALLAEGLEPRLDAAIVGACEDHYGLHPLQALAAH